MKLYTHAASPFSRKVHIALIELELDSSTELVSTNPWQSTPEMLAANPFSKIPALLTDEGVNLFSSAAICDYLDALDGRHRLLPAALLQRARALQRQALADGMMEAGVVILLNAMHKPERVHRTMVTRAQSGIGRALDTLERDAASLDDGFDLGHIALICALDFLVVAKLVDWQADHPRLAAWLAAQQRHSSVTQTKPQSPPIQ
jgi:glutathione S-transferase